MSFQFILDDVYVLLHEQFFLCKFRCSRTRTSALNFGKIDCITKLNMNLILFIILSDTLNILI